MQSILKHLEDGRVCERGGDSDQAVRLYQAACTLIRKELPSLPPAVHLMMSKELMHYETKVYELQGVDLADLLDDNVSLGAPPPPAPSAAHKKLPAGPPPATIYADDSGWKGANNTKSLQRMQQKTLETSKASNACLSDLEISVLKSSSLINGHLYMPWLSGEEKEERQHNKRIETFTKVTR